MKTINLDESRDRTHALREVVVGDVLVFMGTPHQIEVLEPYSPPAAWGIGGVSRVARAADGWGITVFGWVGRQT